MKIAIISDTHFGFKENDSELNLDCYINAYQSFELAIKNNAELILMPGDIFDLEIPTQETFDKTFLLLNTLIGNQKNIPKDKDVTITALPIVVISGTHEYRGKEYKGPVDVLESAKYIYKLEKEHIIFENNNEKIAIHGMKGVPEKVAKDLLDKINFKPIENAKNLIMFHQSFKEFLPFDDEMVATLTLNDLPKGFDLYIDGHIHLSNIITTEFGKFLLPGSTILTQIKKKEIEIPKGMYIYDSEKDTLDFHKIPIQRKYYLEEIKIDKNTKEEIYDLINKYINSLNLESNKYLIFDKEILLKPIIKIKIKGELLSGNKQSDINVKDFENENYIILLDKDLNSKELEEKLKNFDITKEKENALNESTEIFIKNLQSAGFKNTFNPEEMILQLKSEDLDKIKEKIIKREL